MKRILMLCAVILCGCDVKPALQVRESNNAAFKVELLFETDGCRVYRFYDADDDRPRYFTKCQDAAKSGVAWDEQEQQGKIITTVPHDIPTN